MRRTGAALVAALAMLALSAALVSASFAASRSAQVRMMAESGRLAAESAARRTLILLSAGWGPAEDALTPGASVERDLAETLHQPAGAAPTVRGRTRVTRLGDGTFVVAVDVRAGEARLLSRRRLQLLLVRPPLDSASIARGDPPRAPRPVPGWNLADLY